MPKSGRVPQRGWSTASMTLANQAPLEESPPWFSTRTLISRVSANSTKSPQTVGGEIPLLLRGSLGLGVDPNGVAAQETGRLHPPVVVLHALARAAGSGSPMAPSPSHMIRRLFTP